MPDNKLSYKKIVGQQIKTIRRQKNITQSDLAENCGIYRTYLSRIECGVANPSLITLINLACAMDVPPYLLLHTGAESVAQAAVI